MNVKVDIHRNGNVVVLMPARTWESAHDVVERLKETPPRGYRLIESTVKSRGAKRSGRRCNAVLVFTLRSNDDRYPRLTEAEALELFDPYARQAQDLPE